MTARIVLLVGHVLALLASGWAVDAAADDRDPDIGGGLTHDGLWLGAAKQDHADGHQGNPNASSESAGEAIQLGQGGCAAADLAANASLEYTYCPAADPEPADLTIGMIQRAFTELKLPAATAVIEPPDGLTLVNFDTNFYTPSTSPITHTVTLLGQQVTLEATPTTYRWSFGDGESLTTTDPGAPYPDLRVTHDYGKVGTYRPALSTTYSGRFRVGGGAWQQIPGTVTIDGDGQPLRAIEARPQLVGH